MPHREKSFATALPVEILHDILNIVSEAHSDRVITLQSCALVCREFRQHCRPLIYSTVQINFPCFKPTKADYSVASMTPQTFALLVQKHHDIPRFIRTLRYTPDNNSRYPFGPAFLKALRRLSHVESLTIRETRVPNATARPDTCGAIIDILRLPSLKHLVLRVGHFPVSVLAFCSNLKTLDMKVSYDCSPEFITGALVLDHQALPKPRNLTTSSIIRSPFLTSPTVKTASPPCYGYDAGADWVPIVDSSYLETLRFDRLTQDEFIPLVERLKGCQRLHTLALMGHENKFVSWSGLGDLLESTRIRNLRLQFHPSIGPNPGNDRVSHWIARTDILLGLLSELRPLKRPSVEALFLEVHLPYHFISVASFSNWIPDPALNFRCPWSRLAEILASWPRLKQLVLAVKISSDFKNRNDLDFLGTYDFSRELKGLLQNRFAELVDGSGVNFVCTVVGK
ncbi:hypothetical protein CVT24_010724 [Panaeolus cyanescens]|uniref:Uncharacterized protein n=1 Tax=Panaeolus cyanescens TaxID=181874 RepID=A0A409YVY2_9AGAR|nr:hypothetical protein CVT24_010724 [Panaeolus cyanescens]